MTHYATWTDQYEELQAILQNGKSVTVAAATLGRTRDAVYSVLHKRGAGVTALRSDAFRTRTLNQVAALFGVRQPTVRGWVAHGWLKASRNGTRKRKGSKKPAHFLVTDIALMDFIALRAAWMVWEPERITDPLWRDAAQEERANAGGRWVRAVEAVAKQHYNPKYVQHLVKVGRLDAVKVRNIWYVWEAA